MTHKISSKTIYFIITFLFLQQLAFTQDYITVSGKVLNKNTKEPQCYASIGIVGKAIGTTSNSSGDFVFHIPSSLENDSLFISIIGYETFKMKVSALTFIHTFYLLPLTYSLKEVQINAYTAKQIVKKAFKYSNKNFHQRPALYDIYYREFWKKDSTYARSLEAAANIYYKGFQYSFNGVQSKIINIRKSKSYINDRQINNLDVSFYSLSYFLNYYKNYIYTLDSISYFDGHLVYIITAINKNSQDWMKMYSYKETPDGDVIEEESNDSILSNFNNHVFIQKYFITTDKFQILKIDRIEDYRACKNMKIINDRICEYYNGSLSFKIYNDTVYFNYLKNHFYETYYKNEDINKLDFISNILYECYITNITTESVKEIPKNEQPTYRDLYEQDLKYDPEFWKNYNYLVDDSLRKKVFLDLESQRKKEKK